MSIRTPIPKFNYLEFFGKISRYIAGLCTCVWVSITMSLFKILCVVLSCQVRKEKSVGMINIVVHIQLNYILSNVN